MIDIGTEGHKMSFKNILVPYRPLKYDFTTITNVVPLGFMFTMVGSLG